MIAYDASAALYHISQPTAPTWTATIFPQAPSNLDDIFDLADFLDTAEARDLGGRVNSERAELVQAACEPRFGIARPKSPEMERSSILVRARPIKTPMEPSSKTRNIYTPLLPSLTLTPNPPLKLVDYDASSSALDETSPPFTPNIGIRHLICP